MEIANHIVSPLLKWAGGKRHIADLLTDFLPTDWNSGRYYEPFMGGGAMFLRLKPEQSQLSDLNPRLIGFYRFVKDSPETLLDSINQLHDEFESAGVGTKSEVFYTMRARFNESDPHEIESASLLYALNKLCFNGLYRENSKGHFNVPFGNKKKFPIANEDQFLEVSKLLSGAELRTSDFVLAVETAESDDFVYFDPPYIPINLTSSFTAYSSNGFGVDDQKRLADLMRTLTHRGVRAMCSNSDSALTREIYSSLRIDVIQAPRMVSASSDGRKLVNELVIRNYEL
jgi:DNA adenine methylase